MIFNYFVLNHLDLIKKSEMHFFKDLLDKGIRVL